MYRFFIKEEQIHDGMIEICGSDVNHIKNVLRMKTGDKVYLSNGSDLEYECSLLEWTDDTILEDRRCSWHGNRTPSKDHAVSGTAKRR